MERLSGGRIPHERGLALVGDADGRHFGHIHARSIEAGAGGLDLGSRYPEAVLDLAVRVDWGNQLGRADCRAAFVEQDGTRTSGPLVQREDVPHCCPPGLRWADTRWERLFGQR